MNDRNELLSLMLDALERANIREMRFVYVLLCAMLGDEGVPA